MNRSARSAGLPDLFALKYLDFSPLGGPPAMLECDCSPSPLAWLPMALFGWGRHRLVVFGTKRRVESAVHVTGQPRAKRWDVVRTTNVASFSDALAEALHAATFAAGAQNVAHLTARLLDDDPRCRSFEAAGFRPYTRETLFAAELPLGTPADADGMDVQPCRPQHAGSLQRLYGVATPTAVRATEVMTLPEFLRPLTGRFSTGLVIEAAGEIVAAAGSLRRPMEDTAVVRLIVRPEAATAGKVVLEHLLGRLREQGVQTVWLPVREYSSESAAIARRLGFTAVAARGIVVKHTTALIRQPVFARLREAPATLPAVNGSRFVHAGGHFPQCRLRNDVRPRRRTLSVSTH